MSTFFSTADGLFAKTNGIYSNGVQDESVRLCDGDSEGGRAGRRCAGAVRRWGSVTGPSARGASMPREGKLIEA